MEALPFSALWMIEMARADMNNRPMRSDNERMILEIVRRHGGITGAAITGLTNLTQQSWAGTKTRWRWSARLWA